MSHLTQFLFKFVLVATLISPVLSHGIMSKLIIDGTTFDGPPAAENEAKSADSVIRRVANTEPVTSPTDASLNCGRESQKAALVANAQPGSSVQAFWQSGEGGSWPHDVGPMMTYLAQCDGDCTNFDTSSAKFFKIKEAGKDSSGKWAQADLTQGKPHTFTLPSNLAAGNYILRHELIALQNAMSSGGAEFYPSCAQIKVGGSETGKPNDNELVSFPGAYKSDDAGILIDVYSDTSADYKFPGPDVASFIQGGSSGNSGSDSNSGGNSDSGDDSSSDAPTASVSGTVKSSATASAPSASSTSASGGTSSGGSSSSGKCTLKKNKKRSSKKQKKRAVAAHQSNRAKKGWIRARSNQ